MAFKRPTLKDIDAPEQIEPVQEGSKYKRPNLRDMGYTEPEKIPVKFGGGNIKVGFGDHTFDTGIKMSPRFDKFMSGMGRSFAQTGRSLKQLTGNYSKEEALRDAQLDEPLMETGWGKTGDIAGGIAQTAWVPVGGLSSMFGKLIGNVAPKAGASIASSLGVDAALQGALQSQLRPTVGDETRLGNAGRDAAGALLFQKGLQGLGKGAGKVINSVRNKWSNAQSKALDQLAQKYGVDLTMGDLPGNTGWRRFEDISEGIPLSTRSKNMEKTAGQIHDALFDLKADLTPNLTVKDDLGNIINYSDPDEMMVGEIQRNFGNLKKVKDQLFADVASAIDDNPRMTKLTMSKTEKALKELLEAHPKIFEEFKGTDARLNKVMGRLLEDVQDANAARNAAGQFTQKAKYQDAQWLREEIGMMAEQAKRLARNGSMSGKAHGRLEQVYKGIVGDLDDWGTNPKNKAVYDAYTKAQNYYKENIVPFKKNRILSKVVNDFIPYDSDVAVREFFKPGRGKVAQELMKFQTPEGQKAAQFAMLDDVIEDATQDGLNISKFVKGLRKLKKPGEHVYEPEIASRLDDLEKIATAADRADAFQRVSGNTGRWAAVQGARTVSNAIPAISVGAGAGGVAAGASGATIGGLATAGLLGSMLYGTRKMNQMGVTPMGKRILSASSELPGGLGSLVDFIGTKAGGPLTENMLEDGTYQKFRQNLPWAEDDPYAP